MATSRKVEFGDFQTPLDLALRVCDRLKEMGIRPGSVIEPTCGVGAFVLAAADRFSDASVSGYEINGDYLGELRIALSQAGLSKVETTEKDFFSGGWKEIVHDARWPLLVLGNLPWVTSAVVGALGGSNLPEKSNFQGHRGFDAITGKANFDVSEWMLLEILRWFDGEAGDIAMLVKTAVARKVLAHATKQRLLVKSASIIGIDAKKEFQVNVDACLLVIRLTSDPAEASYEYETLPSLHSTTSSTIVERAGLTIRNAADYDALSILRGHSPQKWRSGVKHDCSSVMEFDEVEDSSYKNGLGEVVSLESSYMFPLMKGSDIGSDKTWRRKHVLVTQKKVGEPTGQIESFAPKTWKYLLDHSEALDRRGSTIYAKNPRFSVFGVGDYAFKPWKIAICGLYKKLAFRLIGPINGKPVMFDDTVYFISFDDESEAREVFAVLNSEPSQKFLSSMIFWDEKRPIKSAVLNVFDWSKLMDAEDVEQPTLFN